jgi:hypothetical protein
MALEQCGLDEVLGPSDVYVTVIVFLPGVKKITAPSRLRNSIHCGRVFPSETTI